MLHQLIEDNLEALLSGHTNPDRPSEISAHLSECESCRQVVDGMRKQARWVRALRPADDVAPSPGFYARVLERIEAQTPASLWSFFLDPMFGKRLVYASLTLLAALTAVAVSTDGTHPGESGNPVVVMAAHEYPPTPGIDQSQDRDVVLVNLATWGSGGSLAQPVALESDSQ